MSLQFLKESREMGVKIQLLFLVLTFCLLCTDAASIKKTIDEASTENEIKTETPKRVPKKSPAIIAIEIVDDPQQNTTGKSNSKRTIESSLGYGYNGPLNSYNPHSSHHGKKFVIYKYSQHDIPPSAHYNSINAYSKPYNSHTDIQKSISYNLGTVTSHVSPAPSVATKSSTPRYTTPTKPNVDYYNQQNTFYTTYDQQSLGGVSTQVPYQMQPGIVPVIFLKVYSNQLSNSNAPLHTNLPQSHPYADLNNIDLQAYLQNYLQQYLQSQQVAYQPVYQPTQQAYVQSYQQPEQYQTNLPTYENYPTNKHTGVIFYSDNNGHVPLTKHYKTSDDSSYKQVSYPEYVPPHQSQSNQNSEQQPNVQYVYTTADSGSNQEYMYVYPDDLSQNVYYQDNTAYYQPTQNYKDNSDAAEQEAPVRPHNYHAHPNKHTIKERRSKQLESKAPASSHRSELPTTKEAHE